MTRWLLPALLSTVARLERWRNLAWTGLALLILSYSWMYSAISVPNERSRIYLSVAMVDHGTLSIDKPIKRFGRIYDWARFQGKAYTDKAPGSSFLGAAVYGFVRLFSSPEDWPIQRLINLMRTWLMLPLGLIGFLVMRRTLYALEVDDDVNLILSFGWLLGTSAFHYSTAFYGHQIVGVALLAALMFLLIAEQRVRAPAEAPDSSDESPEQGGLDRRAALLCVAAGACAGVAGLTEYQAGPPCALLALYVFVGPLRKTPALLVAFALGALPFVLMLMAYNHAAFGSPFELSYHHLVVKDLAKLHREGVGGVSLPKMSLMGPVMFSLHRGLFTTCPVLLLTIPGVVWCWRDGHRRLAGLVGFALVFNILFVAGTRAWFGGWSFGPRLMVPGMSWMAIGAAIAAQHMRGALPGQIITRGLVLAGIFYHQLVHIAFPELPESAKVPLLDVVFPVFKTGSISPNLMTALFQAKPLPSLIPLTLALLPVVLVVTLLHAPTRGEPQEDTPAAGGDGDNAAPQEPPSPAPHPVHGPSRGRRALIAAASWWAVLALVGASFAMGSSWSKAKKRRHDVVMARWDRHERANSARFRALPGRPARAKKPARRR